MTSLRNVVLLAFDGVQILDITGPGAVFAAANDAAGMPFYRVHVLSSDGGPITSNSSIVIETKPLNTLSASSVDTLLIAGGDDEGLNIVAANKKVERWVKRVSTQARRFGSICTGTFVLGRFGLIDGKRVATHWSACAQLAGNYPNTEVDSNALYVRDGHMWTSAGVTTGIDMSLELVTADLGNAVANAIAKRLVMYARRPGYQSQFSSVLHAQAHANAPFTDLINWMKENLLESLNVSTLAAQVAMSERTFQRKFAQVIGESPARFVETLRLDHVRYLLATGMSLKEIASKTGYSNASQLSKAFDRRFGMAPHLFRQMHYSLTANVTM